MELKNVRGFHEESIIINTFIISSLFGFNQNCIVIVAYYIK